MNETIRRQPPPTLTPSIIASTLPYSKPIHQSPFSTSSPSPYVLQIASTTSNYILSASDDTINYYDKELKKLGVLPANQKGLTELVRGAGEGSNVIFSAAKDATVSGYDMRDPRKAAFTLKGKSGAPYLVCSQSADLNCLAVGTELYHHEATIDLWDLRTLAPSHTYTEAHSDDLTSLSFHPTLSHLLISGSVDGLINSYDIRLLNEDDAVISTAQVGASVSQSGWMGIGGDALMKGVWSATTIETLMIWDATDFTQLEDLGDVRDIALQPWRSDYLITCAFDQTSGGLYALTGTQKGDVAVMNLSDPSHWVMERILPSVGGRTLGGDGHSDIVRCADVDFKSRKIVTGGEDGVVCMWTL